MDAARLYRVTAGLIRARSGGPTPKLRLFASPMSPLFRKSEEKVMAEAAMQAEIERLKTLSVEDLAAALLPGLRPEDAGQRTSLRVQQLCDYLVRDLRGARKLQPLQLTTCVNEALDRLQGAELVASISHQRSPVWRITRLGEATLADGTVERRLGEAG
jgi:hypothetical protein